MDGRNSSGRRISLLNDADVSAPALCSRTSSYVSTGYARSYSSTPCLSPQTPSLSRSSSSDSGTSMQTPSPVTPSFSSFDSLPLPQQSGKDALSSYPPVSHAATGPLPYPQAAFGRPSSPDEASSTGTAPSANPKSKKNSYPCPLAKQYSCNDYFTTSGHAARHAKKHTGKKDAFCPECNKAFTRKDNMEQHRRTHLSGRAASKGSDRDARKAKVRTAQRPKLEHFDSEASTSTLAHVNVVDPALPGSPSEQFALPVQAANSYVDYNGRGYPDPNAAYHNLPYGGLNALANAATSQQEQQQSPRFEDEEDMERRHY